MRYKLFPLLALLPLLASTCDHDQEILCGDPAVGVQVTYELIDAATGQDWYAGPGRPSGDSLRLLASAGYPAVPGRRAGSRVLLGPLLVNRSDRALVNSQQTVTQYLGVGNGDVDTLQVVLHYFPEPQSDPCGFGPGIDEVTVTYNGRANGVFRAAVPADSLSGPVLYKVVRLLKR